METHIYHLHTFTALHVGVGQGSGVIDLPIAREKATSLPVVPGSAVKGVLREELRPAEGVDRTLWRALFGPEKVAESEAGFAGALVVGDARLLCLPVRSLRGTFAFATCPLVLRRYIRDWQVLEAVSGVPEMIPSVNNADCLTTGSSKLQQDGKVYLEDLDLDTTADADQLAERWAEFIAGQVFPGDTDWMTLFQERFAILPDAIFDFLAETATEIRARVKLKEGTRTVQKGALWYEENLPAESLLWGLLAMDRDFSDNKVKHSRANLLAALPRQERLQIGGKASVGRGQVRWLLT